MDCDQAHRPISTVRATSPRTTNNFSQKIFKDFYVPAPSAKAPATVDHTFPAAKNVAALLS